MAANATTYYVDDAEDIPALLHASKARLLSTPQTCNVDFDRILRGQADEEDPGTLRVVAILNNFHD